MDVVSQRVFVTVVSLTLVSGTTSLYLASRENLTPMQIRVFEMASTTWQTGVGAVFGLLGGKTLTKRVNKN